MSLFDEIKEYVDKLKKDILNEIRKSVQIEKKIKEPIIPNTTQKETKKQKKKPKKKDVEVSIKPEIPIETEPGVPTNIDENITIMVDDGSYLIDKEPIMCPICKKKLTSGSIAGIKRIIEAGRTNTTTCPNCKTKFEFIVVNEDLKCRMVV